MWPNYRKRYGVNKMDVEKIKTRRSYAEIKEWLAFLNTNPGKKELLKKFYTIKDFAGGYGSQRNADAALESLEVVLNEARVV
jgi:hypothetical protein